MRTLLEVCIAYHLRFGQMGKYLVFSLRLYYCLKQYLEVMVVCDVYHLLFIPYARPKYSDHKVF
jgi:hypothetical protein